MGKKEKKEFLKKCEKERSIKLIEINEQKKIIENKKKELEEIIEIRNEEIEKEEEILQYMEKHKLDGSCIHDFEIIRSSYDTIDYKCTICDGTYTNWNSHEYD